MKRFQAIAIAAFVTLLAVSASAADDGIYIADSEGHVWYCEGGDCEQTPVKLAPGQSFCGGNAD